MIFSSGSLMSASSTLSIDSSPFNFSSDGEPLIDGRSVLKSCPKSANFASSAMNAYDDSVNISKLPLQMGGDTNFLTLLGCIFQDGIPLLQRSDRLTWPCERLIVETDSQRGHLRLCVL